MVDVDVVVDVDVDVLELVLVEVVVDVLVDVEVEVVVLDMHVPHKTGQTDLIRSFAIFESHCGSSSAPQSNGGSSLLLQLPGADVAVLVLVLVVVDVDVEVVVDVDVEVMVDVDVEVVVDVDVIVVATHVSQSTLHAIRKSWPIEGWLHNALLFAAPAAVQSS